MQEVNKNLRKWRKINHEKIKFVFLWKAYILLTIFVIEEDGSASLLPSSSCRWSETKSPNCGHQQAYCSLPSLYMSMKTRGRRCQLGKNPIRTPEYSLTILPAEPSSSKLGGSGRRK
jgi:hypothetical protein